MRFTVLTLIAVSLLACSTSEPMTNPNTQQPEVSSLTADKTTIKLGEMATITCIATGGELNYEWDVLLGDIIPTNTDGSIVTYSGSECCSGERIVSCTVSNDKGSVTELITLTILEE